MKDLQEYDVDGPKIPDPEQVRLLLHADNARGGMPIYAIEPELDDSDWTEWLENSADKQASISNLLSTLTTSRRWKKTRSNAISKVTRNDAVDVDMGAAATSCAAWWIEEQGGLTAELISQRNARFAARLRGSLADLLNSRVDDAEASECTLLVPVHQAWLPSLEAAVMAWPDLEQVSMEA